MCFCRVSSCVVCVLSLVVALACSCRFEILQFWAASVNSQYGSQCEHMSLYPGRFECGLCFVLKQHNSVSAEPLPGLLNTSAVQVVPSDSALERYKASRQDRTRNLCWWKQCKKNDCFPIHQWPQASRRGQKPLQWGILTRAACPSHPAACWEPCRRGGAREPPGENKLSLMEEKHRVSSFHHAALLRSHYIISPIGYCRDSNFFFFLQIQWPEQRGDVYSLYGH